MKRLKKCMSLFLAGCLIFALFGCGNRTDNSRTDRNESEESRTPVVNVPASESEEGAVSEDETEENNTTEQEEAPDNREESTSDSHVLIAYFSWADNAEDFDPDDIDADVLGHASVVTPGDVGVIAQYIEERTQADVFKIIVTEPYSYDYDETLDQGRNQRDAGARPELVETVENMDDYDVIFLGFPNWWYTIPVAIHSFVEAYDLSGKTIIPFVTHGTGGLSGTIRDLTAALPESCEVLQSYDVFEDDVFDVQDEVNEWLSGLGY